MLADLRNHLFRHLQRLSLGFYERNRAGVLISRLTNDVEALDQLVTDGVTSLIQNTLTLVGAAVILFLLSWRLALATLVVIPPLIVATAIFRKKSGRSYRARPRDARRRHGDARRGHRRDARPPGVHARARRARELPAGRRGLPAPQPGDGRPERPLLPVRRPALVARDGDHPRLRRLPRLRRPDDDRRPDRVPRLLRHFFDPVQQLSQLYSTFLSAVAALDKIMEVLVEEPQVTDGPDAQRARRASAATSGSTTSTSPTAPAPEVLHGIDLDVPAGTTVALVGHTGAGKSTIAKLIARFYDPTEGAITIDGIDLRDVTQESLRRQLGIVPQEGFLFAGTVAENIAFGRPGRRARGDRLRRARGRRRRVHRRSSRTATTPSSASAAPGSRSASASSSPSRARCSPTRAS